MAVAFDNATNPGQDFNLATWAVTKPAFVGDGDLMLCAHIIDGSGTINSTPSGWNLIGAAQASATDAELRVWWKVASSEGASWSWVYAAVETGTAAVVTFTGAHATTPIGTSNGTDYTQGQLASGTAVAAGPITPPVNNCAVIAFYGSDPTAGQAMTDDASPDGLEIIDDINGTNAWIGAQYFLQGTAAAITLDATMVNSDSYAWVIAAIRPAAAAAGAATLPARKRAYEKLLVR